MRRTTALVWLALVLSTAPGCALKKMAMSSVADSLARNGDGFAADNDPELIRAAVPFSLKLVESLLLELPRHRGLLLTACSGFTQYGYAFVENDAEFLRDTDYRTFVRLHDRSRKMYLRARDYCLRSLTLKYPGIVGRLAVDPDRAAAELGNADLALLYWTAAASGKVFALSLDDPALLGGFPAVRALIRRGLQLDESFNKGALHEIMIALEAVPEAMGGSPARARLHFERALALSNRSLAGPFVTFARSVLVPQQRRDEFVQVLNEALQIDVDRDQSRRLPNILAQEQARFLLDHVDALFLQADRTR